MYLNSSTPNLNTPIHEFGHLWIDAIEGTELYDRGAELVKETPYWERVNSDPNYKYLSETARTKEAMAMAIGDKGESVKQNLGLFIRIKAWVYNVWKRIGAQFDIQNLTSEQIQDLTFNDFVDVAVSELLNGKPLSPKGEQEIKLPDTIDINGAQRPTLNSNGKPIHSTEEGIRNFWKWVGDSKVVDELGRPLVVYHGTRDDSDFTIFDYNKAGKGNDWGLFSRGFYFTPNKKTADQYRGLDGNIYVSYLKIKNPIYLNQFENKKELADYLDVDEGIISDNSRGFGVYNSYVGTFTSHIKEKGHDGVIIIPKNGKEIQEIVSYSPTQIKSATDNDGSFNPNDPDIRFQIIGERGAAALDAAEEATHRLDNLRVAREMEKSIEEKKARIEKLKASNPIEITGEEITPSDDLKQYKKNAIEYGKTLQGKYINKDTGETIQLQRGRKNGGLKEVLQHDYLDKEHLQSIAAIPEIIENGIFISKEANMDYETNPNVKEFQSYLCGLKIAGVDYTVRATVAVEDNGDRYYDHKLTKIEKGALIDHSVRVTNPANGESTPLSWVKDNRLLRILQIPDVKSIRLATGWEKGVDGKWRYEIPDNIGNSKFEDFITREYSTYESTKIIEKELEQAKKNKNTIFNTEEQKAVEDLRLKLQREIANNGKSTEDAQKEFAEFLKQFNPDERIKKNELLITELKEKLEKENNKPVKRDNAEKEDFTLEDLAKDIATIYPELKSLPISVEINDTYYGAGMGAYIRTSNKGIGSIEIVLPEKPTISNAKGILIHEIQHAIQEIEGFAKGGSADSFPIEKMGSEMAIRKLQKQRDDFDKTEVGRQIEKKMNCLMKSSRTQKMLLKRIIKSTNSI